MTEIGLLNKPEFLSQGAIFGDSKSTYFMWGEPRLIQDVPATQWAICHWDFFNGHLGWKTYPNQLKVSKMQSQKMFDRNELSASWQTMDRTHFDQQFELIRGWFGENRLTKIVPYCFEEGHLSMNDLNRESMISHLLSNDRGYIYGQWDDSCGIVGLTPETLIEQLTESQFKTMAVAGTTSQRLYHENPEAFFTNEKEVVEHEKVVLNLKEKLTKLGDVQLGARSILETPNLVHLYTEMEMESHLQIEEIARALHPTPALGCYPAEEWREFMGAFDKIAPRHGFGAPFGFFQNDHQAHFVVAIRNMTWEKDRIKIGSGCGVVKQSDADSEWNELFLKRNSVKKILGLR